MLQKLFKSKPAQARADKQPPVLLIRDDQERLIALGLTWRVMVAGGSNATAKRLAIAAKATHYCVVDGQTAGLATITGKSKKGTEIVTPAATVACSRFGGNGLFALQFGADAVWYFVMRNGLPTGSESIIRADAKNGDSALDIALVACKDAVEQNPDLAIYTDLDIDFEGIATTDFSLKSLTELTWQSSMGLIPIVNNDKTTLPVPILIAGAVVVCGYAGWSYYSDYVSANLAEEKRLALERANKQDDPVLAWRQALNTAMSGAVDANNVGVGLVRKSLQTTGLPATMNGWDLKTVTCTALPFVQSTQKWTCNAQYSATESVTTATNSQLKEKIPAAFTVSFSPIKQMTLKWEVSSQVKPVELKLLPERSEHLVQTASKLQTQLPSLTNTPNFSFEPLKVIPPLSVEKKTAIAMPAGFDIPAVAIVQVEGPLRSIDAVVAKNM